MKGSVAFPVGRCNAAREAGEARLSNSVERMNLLDERKHSAERRPTV